MNIFLFVILQEIQQIKEQQRMIVDLIQELRLANTELADKIEQEQQQSQAGVATLLDKIAGLEAKVSELVEILELEPGVLAELDAEVQKVREAAVNVAAIFDYQPVDEEVGETV